MEYDLELAEKCRETGDSYLRFYGWKPYCISLGYNQGRNQRPIDIAKCGQDGIDVVTRPTGGRAVLHAEELTYSVVMRTNKPARAVYAEISEALLRGLKSIDAGNPGLQNLSGFASSTNPGRSNICFVSSVKNEINYLGRKLVGSAQRRFGDVILQHGSVLIGDYHKNIVKYICNPTFMSATCLNEIMGREVSYEEVGEGIKKGFEDYFKTDMKVGFRKIPAFAGMTEVQTA